MEIKRNVMWGQWANRRFVLQLGTTAFVFGKVRRDPVRGDYYAARVEILTPEFWCRVRAGKWGR
jgi:hypothetical protein